MCSSITAAGFLVPMRSPHRRAAPPRVPAAGQASFPGATPLLHSVAAPLCPGRSVAQI